MNNVLLSICISSYNHGDKCVQLVNDILSLKDNRYNIVICDDCSDENTVRELRTLTDPKVTLIQNKSNLGPCANWYKTIDSGTGRYSLHILDRDTIAVNYLPLILDILEENFVGGGYFGRTILYPVKGIEVRKSYAICKKGRDAFLTMAGIPIHPTGFFVQKAVWKAGNYRKYFLQSNVYGIYPHSYVFGEIAINNNLIFSPIAFYSYAYRGSTKISRFYEGAKNKEYWWLPQNVIKTGDKLIFYLSRIAGISYKEEFICTRFKDTLDRATLVYKKITANQQEMEHYGLTASYISGWKLLWISVKYKISFICVLKKIGIDSEKIRKQIQDIWIENMKTIVEEIKGERNCKLISLSNKNLLHFQVMNQWVKIKQKGLNLSAYFVDRRYTRIAIYGVGIIGQVLLDELRETDVEVAYGIDRNAYKVYAEVNVLSPDESLPKVDAVVVTTVESFDKVKQSLKGKVDCPVISLRDVVYDV